MNKQEYLSELADKLEFLSRDEIEKSVNFYAEMIDDRIEDGMSESTAVEAVGSIDVAVKSIMFESTPLPTLVKTRISNSKKSAANRGLWIALVILGSPLWLPIVAAITIAILSIYIVIWCVAVTLYALELSFLIAGMAGIITGFFYFFSLSWQVGLAYIGTGLMCIAITIFMFPVINTVARAIIGLSKFFGRRVKAAFVKKEVRNEN